MTQQDILKFFKKKNEWATTKQIYGKLKLKLSRHSILKNLGRLLNEDIVEWKWGFTNVRYRYLSEVRVKRTKTKFWRMRLKCIFCSKELPEGRNKTCNKKCARSYGYSMDSKRRKKLRMKNGI